MISLKRGVAVALGAASTILGAWLRLAAKGIAWPHNFSYSGPRENTEWAIRERAYEDLGLTILIFGLAVLLVVLVNWIWTPLSSGRERA